jgi:hypothetical protein
VTDGGHVFSFGFMQTIIRLLAGMTDDQPKRGRPSDYSFQVAISICARLAEGKSLRAICSEAGMPGRATVFRWMRATRNFAKSTYSCASFGRKI